MLQDKLKNYYICLASNSPRRKQFLSDLGIAFSVKSPDIEETYPEKLEKEEIVKHIAMLKADSFNNLEENEIIITCDTMVFLGNQAIGKPTDAEDAVKILSLLSGRHHEVISAVCLKSNNKKIVFHDTTKVFFRELSEKEIRFYVEYYKPLDKAGAYGIQDWIGLVGIEKINGSYTNVVGLPMEKLYTQLIHFVK